MFRSASDSVSAREKVESRRARSYFADLKAGFYDAGGPPLGAASPHVHEQRAEGKFRPWVDDSALGGLQARISFPAA